MTRYTNRWGLSVLGPGDSLQDDGFKYADADRQLLDRLLTVALEQHHHTGSDGSDRTPAVAANLTLATSGGSMPSGSRFYYQYTIVDANGSESAPSPTASIDTPSSPSEPNAPSGTYLTGSGSLLPGTYSYVCSAYNGANTIETKALRSASVRIPGSATANSITLSLPDLPLGATGLNIYRLPPNGLQYLYLTSIHSPSSGDTWLDDGATTPDSNRGLPPLNRAASENLVTVALPGATPSIPDGCFWRIYRSDNPTDWGRSYLVDVTPEGATPVTPLSFTDVGSGTLLGGPPTVAQAIKSPPRIDFTDAAEVSGSLPPGRLAVPHIVTFSQAGPLAPISGTFTWVCDYTQADIVSCRAYLGVDSVPAAQDVIIDVNALRPSAGSSTWQSIFADGPSRPRVPTGENVGDPTVPTTRHLAVGDSLCVDVDQAGGGATPTDVNLTVNILMFVQYGSQTTSYQWLPS